MILTNTHKNFFQNWFKSSTLNYIRNNFNFTKIKHNIKVNKSKNITKK
jgi:hypothetical protein